MTVRSIIFNAVTKHGVHVFVPNTALGFEDPDAVPYFVACGWGEETTETPVHTYSLGEVDIDPATVHRATGFLVSDIIANGGTPAAAAEQGVKAHSDAGILQVDSIEADTEMGGHA